MADLPVPVDEVPVSTSGQNPGGNTGGSPTNPPSQPQAPSGPSAPSAPSAQSQSDGVPDQSVALPFLGVPALAALARRWSRRRR